MPTVVEFLGHGGGRALAHMHLLWASAGFAHFVIDTRGHGSQWGGGETPDPVGSAPAGPGFMTRGITRVRVRVRGSPGPGEAARSFLAHAEGRESRTGAGVSSGSSGIRAPGQ